MVLVGVREQDPPEPPDPPPLQLGHQHSAARGRTPTRGGRRRPRAWSPRWGTRRGSRLPVRRRSGRSKARTVRCGRGARAPPRDGVGRGARLLLFSPRRGSERRLPGGPRTARASERPIRARPASVARRPRAAASRRSDAAAPSRRGRAGSAVLKESGVPLTGTEATASIPRTHSAASPPTVSEQRAPIRSAGRSASPRITAAEPSGTASRFAASPYGTIRWNQRATRGQVVGLGGERGSRQPGEAPARVDPRGEARGEEEQPEGGAERELESRIPQLRGPAGDEHQRRESGDVDRGRPPVQKPRGRGEGGHQDRPLHRG